VMIWHVSWLCYATCWTSRMLHVRLSSNKSFILITTIIIIIIIIIMLVSRLVSRGWAELIHHTTTRSLRSVKDGQTAVHLTSQQRQQPQHLPLERSLWSLWWALFPLTNACTRVPIVRIIRCSSTSDRTKCARSIAKLSPATVDCPLPSH